jgi:hypothetical protein
MLSPMPSAENFEIMGMSFENEFAVVDMIVASVHETRGVPISDD